MMMNTTVVNNIGDNVITFYHNIIPISDGNGSCPGRQTITDNKVSLPDGYGIASRCTHQKIIFIEEIVRLRAFFALFVLLSQPNARIHTCALA